MVKGKRLQVGSLGIISKASTEESSSLREVSPRTVKLKNVGDQAAAPRTLSLRSEQALFKASLKWAASTSLKPTTATVCVEVTLFEAGAAARGAEGVIGRGPACHSLSIQRPNAAHDSSECAPSQKTQRCL